MPGDFATSAVAAIHELRVENERLRAYLADARKERDLWLTRHNELLNDPKKCNLLRKKLIVSRQQDMPEINNLRKINKDLFKQVERMTAELKQVADVVLPYVEHYND